MGPSVLNLVWEEHCGFYRYLTKLYVASVNSELGKLTLPTVQEHPLLVSGGCASEWWVSRIVQSPQQQVHSPLGSTWVLLYGGQGSIYVKYQTCKLCISV